MYYISWPPHITLRELFPWDAYGIAVIRVINVRCRPGSLKRYSHAQIALTDVGWRILDNSARIWGRLWRFIIHVNCRLITECSSRFDFNGAWMMPYENIYWNFMFTLWLYFLFPYHFFCEFLVCECIWNIIIFSCFCQRSHAARVPWLHHRPRDKPPWDIEMIDSFILIVEFSLGLYHFTCIPVITNLYLGPEQV